MNDSSLAFLRELETVIESRRAHGAPDSYTARLFAAGPQQIAQKIGEEGVELALASVEGRHDRIVSEAADLTYHLIVLLCSHGLGLEDVVTELRRRRR